MPSFLMTHAGFLPTEQKGCIGAPIERELAALRIAHNGRRAIP